MDNDTICRASQGNNGEELVISFDFTIRCVDDVLSLHLFGGYVGGIYGIIFDITILQLWLNLLHTLNI
jgi:hypothetical protein